MKNRTIKMYVDLGEDDVTQAEVSFDYSPYDSRDAYPEEDLEITEVKVDGVDVMNKVVDIKKLADEVLEMIHKEYAERDMDESVDNKSENLLVEMANSFFGNDDELDVEVQSILTEGTEDIEVEHEGLEKLPEGGWKKKTIDQLVSHFIRLAKSKGKGPVMRSILNIERWNENSNKSLSKKSRAVIDALKSNKTWNNI